MTHFGHVRNGVVVLEGTQILPEGATVIVAERPKPASAHRPRVPVQLPIFPSDQPGSIALTNDRIAEILDRDDASS